MIKLKTKRQILLLGVGIEVAIVLVLGLFLIKTINRPMAEEWNDETLVDVDVRDLVKTTYNYMLRRIRDDGTFDYQVDLDTGEVATEYGLIRHTGAMWGLLEAYDDYGDEKDLEKIKTTLDYVINKIKYKDEKIAYIVDETEWHGQNKVAENAMMILGLIKYSEIENDEEYLKMARALADGLAIMQTEAGQYYHHANNNYEGMELESSNLYDGEINLALIRMYQATGEEKYLAVVKKSLNFLAVDGYLMKRDQWVSYVYLSLLDIMDNTEYEAQFLNNIKKNVQTFDKNKGITDMEYLGNAYKYVETLLTRGENAELETLLEDIKGIYYRRAVSGLEKLATAKNGIGGTEYEGAFLMDEHVARIDISQHNLSGYRMFYDYFYQTESPEALARYAVLNIPRRENENEYVYLARRAVETYVRTGKTLGSPVGLPNELMEANPSPVKMENGLYGGGRGVYVTIRNQGKLRGCRGSYYVTEDTLAREIIKEAIKSASDDKRMEPVKIDELGELSYEVSILDEPVKVVDKSELNPEVYGIMIVQNGHMRVLMLPGLDTIKSVDEQIEKTLKKGDVGEGEAYEIYKFTTTKYK